MRAPQCVHGGVNEAYRLSAGVEIAYELGRIDDIPSFADACIRLREYLGDQTSAKACREMTARYLTQAGRPELAERYRAT
jgi:hypothetical protein